MLPIEKTEYLDRLGLSELDFTSRLDLPDFNKITKVISLREMTGVSSIAPIKMDMAIHLISNMRTMNGHYPFRKSKIKKLKYDPNNLKVGQRFAYEENLTSVLKNIPSFFKNYMIPCGVSELGAWFIFGKDKDDTPSLACYLPPIVERHGKNQVIMDGIHRNYIAKQYGVSINAILIEDISIPFPCGMREWEELQIISLDKKPTDINKRYFDLTKELFRDLKYLGIDG